jgi:predicted PurR-regulated permease PerM
MNDNVAQRIYFGGLLLVVTAAFIWLVRGFVQPIFWAVALAIVFFPLHGKLCRLFKGRTALAAATSVIVILLIVVLPLGAIVTAMAAEAAGLVERIQSNEINVSAAIFFIMLYLLYFFMRDGTRILEGLVRALPLGDERERHLLNRFAEVSRATIKGTLVVGLVQGFIGGVLFAMLGIGAPVLWGVVMALLSIIPAVGPAVVWLPAAVILIVQGSILQGIVLIVAGSLVVGLVDNLLRPILVGRDTKMPDYLILLSTLGGLTAFGIAGIVIGPIIAAFFLSVWEMAEEEYADIHKE